MNTPARTTPAEPERRRRRPPVSCTLCRKRKIKCNRESPCNNCIRSKNSKCEYVELSPPPRQRRKHSSPEKCPTEASEEPQNLVPVSSASQIFGGTLYIGPHSTSPNTPTSESSTREIELLNKIKQLETQLANAGVRSTASAVPSQIWDSHEDAPQIAGTFHTNREAPSEGKAPTIIRTIMHKTRVFGQSHWIHGVAQLQDILHQCEPIMFRENSKAILDLKKCKYLGRIIKDQRTPPWPTAPMSELPPKDLADALVDIYLRTFESRYRVLHIPTFRRDYEALWGTEDRDVEFVLQLKLVMAIGAVMYDENYSLRATSIRWIYEAQTWIAEPDFKARLTIQFIQTNTLLLLAREVVGVGGGLVWISIGELLRTAIYIGLHRDPSYLPKISIFDSEIRRRLWNTIIEMAVNASLESGGPPLLSFDDFDTHPPGNFDDEDITAEDPIPKPDGTFTQMSIPLALRKMFEARLGIAKSLNWIGMHSCYEEVLRLDVNLRTSYKLVCRTLDSYRSSRFPSPFQIQTLDFIVRRYLLALHIPFFPASFEDTTYAFSRKVVVDTALQIWCTTNPSSGMMVNGHDDQTPSNDLSRLTICGMGPLRLITLQSCFLIATELRKQLQNEDNLGSVPLRRDLLTVLEDSREWCWKSLVVGESNTKGYLMLGLINTQIHALMSRIPDDELPMLLMQSAEETLAKCLTLFEERVGEGDEVQVGLDGINDMVFEDLLGSKGDYNFMVSESFESGVADSIFWPGNWIA